ncbi:amino acid adenylation domain-containing protein [Pseudonocardia alaniniphila]|uniref:Amino acid adenylation domain-containing protein n=1 Tax=Pseudonocardia alaniniphila TaxID=75291 RepID=A0ABS9TF66_9PSEU|nr:amino acid adenylation domain-containing protein [Pseudonocardia alaniniphila]MCH6167171.1 amino acid adenylation domain-containing protein [Pseudonocardia alaniniphila]
METVTPSVADGPRTAFPVDLIRAQARAAGHREALVDERESLTYTALIDRVDALAQRLRVAGAGPQRPVAVLLERSTDTVIAMLAVLTAGGAYCPLDITAPDARTAAMVRRLGCGVAVADRAGAQRLPSGITVVDPVGLPATFHTTPVNEDALAYVMHTSGSTGVPKGVGMTHRGLSRLISWQLASGETGLRTLQFTATSFDVTFQEVLSTLAAGGCLVVAPEQVRRDPAALLDAIVRHRIERLFLPYVALQLLAVEAGRREVTPDSLRHVVTAGERLIVTPAIRDLFAALPHCRLDNHYGPTEAHLVTSLTLSSDPAEWPEMPGIGTPVGGVVCRVLDGQLRTLSDGGVGELYVGGTGLAQGYLGDPAQTSERFIASPFDDGERLYRTGDLVRVSADGHHEFLGRADGQLKVRGFRVEPGEVEQALLRHPGIDAAAIDLREVADGVSVLVGYVQTHGPVAHRDIIEHLRGLLPAYMIPARYVHVAALPRTATGKVDRRALAELELPAGQETPVADAASLTDTITDIWARVLGHDEFAGDDDFFDVGGDSLLATWVVAELGQVLGRPVELSLLLDYTTVDELADALGSTSAPRSRHRSSQIVTLRPGSSGRGVYLVHPLGGELLGYRELAHASAAPVRLLGIGWTGDPPKFGSTLTEIARTHVEQLRTVEPDGPYWLAGWSFGGVLAYEMAQQLRAAGADVRFLGLFDANPVIDPITGLPMAETPFLDMLDTVTARLDDPATTHAELIELTPGPTWLQLMGAPITAKTSSTYLRKVLDTARACMNAAMRYEPEPYPGPVHLFEAAGADPDLRARLTAVMRGLCTGPLTVVPITGEHWTFIRGENVAEAAARLDAALERVGAEGSTQHGS